MQGYRRYKNRESLNHNKKHKKKQETHSNKNQGKLKNKKTPGSEKINQKHKKMQHSNKKHDDPFKIMKRCYQNANLIPKGPLNPKLNLQKCAGLSAIQKRENQKTKKTKNIPKF